MSGREVVIDQGAAVQDALDIGLAGRILEENLQVKDKTLIDASVWNAGMQDAAMHKDQFPRLYPEAFFVEGDQKGTAKHPDQLIFGVPVIVHDIARMILLHKIVFEGKGIGSVLLFFIEGKVLHKLFSFNCLGDPKRKGGRRYHSRPV